jgi:hypothetical protein
LFADDYNANANANANNVIGGEVGKSRRDDTLIIMNYDNSNQKSRMGRHFISELVLKGIK